MNRVPERTPLGGPRHGVALRGQPLVLLAAVLFGWVGLRAALWESPFPGVSVESFAAGAGTPVFTTELETTRPAEDSGRAGPDRAKIGDVPSSGGLLERSPQALARPAAWQRLPSPRAGAPSISAPARGVPAALSLARRLSESTSAGFAPQAGEVAPAPAGAMLAGAASPVRRWSADGWLLLRAERDARHFGGTPGYGRSQAGAVLRHGLAPASGHAPQIHLRGSVALADAGNDLRESEVAAGLSARPIPRVPVRLAAEMRLSDTDNGVEVRPAAYAVTELSPARLPFGTRGELYLQGGWVGGTYETAFVDGQARIDKPLARLGPAELSAGAAVWGGAQLNAERLDVGPSASASFALGRLRGRLTADYRFRVAGDARPASGPALTLSAGF